MARIVTDSYPDFVRMSFSSQQQSCWVFQDDFINLRESKSSGFASALPDPRTTMDNPSSLLWGVLFSSVGVGYFIYGKKQGRVVALAAGIALMVFPYFVANSFLIVLIGIVLMALPYFIRS